MRAKQVLRLGNISAKAKLVWSRITFSRLTTAYFILAVVHNIIQVILQVQAFSINASAANTLWELVQRANETQEANGFAILSNDLRICYTVPNSINADDCTVIWNGGNNSSSPHGIAVAEFSTSVIPTPASDHNPLPATTLVASEISTSALPQLPPTPLVAAHPTSLAVSTITVLVTATPVPAAISTSNHTVATSTGVDLVVSPTGSPHTATTLVIPRDETDDDDEYHVLSRLFKYKRTLGVTSTLLNGSTPGFNISGLSSDLSSNNTNSILSLQLSDNCVQTLIWPVQMLSNTKREDITLIGFQIWVLSMSIVALLNESIPHICAALVTHLLVTVWTIFEIFQTEQFRQEFARLTTNGACSPHNLLGTYWDQRKDAEIMSAVFNGVTLLLSAFLTNKLMKIYGWQTFKRVGASLTINRIYKLVLSLSIAIQLALFFVVSAAALWLDQLYNGAIGRLATMGSLYKGGIILTFCILVPWLSLGWFSIRREMRKCAMLFLFLSLALIGLWAAIFKSTAFRWTFVVWPFFAVMAVTSGTLMILTFLLAVACRFNFGKGLPRYLNIQEPLENNDFTPVFPETFSYDGDPEKVEFPSSNLPIPTFSATFGKGSEVPRPSQMHFGSQHAVGVGPVSHRRGASISTTVDSLKTDDMSRSDSRGSQVSYNSDIATRNSLTSAMGKRWVIE
ncbi:hypothetical protein K439DRAFT_1379802 [Ramaria rubella]|nr:hypothetical protein K439DRAFT_1379802 [Ramaria rubella]